MQSISSGMNRANLRRSVVLAALVAMAGLMGSADRAYGWGMGHATQSRMVFDSLPKEIKDFFGPALQQEIIQHWCHYPDEVQFFDEKVLGKDAVETLKRMDVGKSRNLHSDVNVAACFVLLEKAFIDKDPKHAAVWLGSIIHTIGDDDCHIGQMSWAGDMARYKGVKHAEGLCELSMMDETEMGRTMLKKKMEGFKPEVLGDDPDKVICGLLLLAYTSMGDGATKACRISSTYNYGEKGIPCQDGTAAMAELGALGAQEAINAILTAWEFAKQNKKAEMTEGLVKKGRLDIDKYLTTKPLSQDSVYDGTLESSPKGPAVGVLLDPSSCMGDSRFGFTACVYLAQAMRTLKEASVDYLPLDTRKVEKDGLPAADKMPVLFVLSGGYEFQQRPYMAKYIKDGGKVIWVGGRDCGLLGKLSASLKPADPKLLPVGRDYEDAKKEGAKAVARVSVKFLGEFADVLGKDSRKFVNDPNLAGWDTPHCNDQIVPTDASAAVMVKPLIAVGDGADTMNVGAALMEDGKARHVFLPQYILLPFVLSDDQAIDFGHPTFDSVGKKILLTSVRMLAPELMPKDK
jgi:hypothetical protein